MFSNFCSYGKEFDDILCRTCPAYKQCKSIVEQYEKIDNMENDFDNRPVSYFQDPKLSYSNLAQIFELQEHFNFMKDGFKITDDILREYKMDLYIFDGEKLIKKFMK